MQQVVIKARSGRASINWREMLEYRDLLLFLVWRGVKVRYAQTILGLSWAVIQPVFSMVVFTLIFGKLAGIPSDGAPYALFTFVAVVPWTFFSTALTESANSLVANSQMLTKVYFPRLILPLSAVLAKVVDFVIAMILVMAMMAWYGLMPTTGILVLPFLCVVMMSAACGLGFWLAAAAVQYRDVKHALGFGIQLLMYAAPVVYPASLVPGKYQLVYALNPMVGVIEGFRAALLATRPMPWDLILVGGFVSFLLAISGAVYFRRREKIFADVA
jgi:lipopolysaccharide transport system permease protein